MSATLKSATRAEVAGRLSLALGALNRRIRAANTDLSVGLVSTLATIVDHDDLRPSDVARIEQVAAPSATRMIADLERRGLVVRETHPDDRRAVLLRATPEGAEALASGRRERAERMLGLLDGAADIDVAKLELVIEVLEGLLTHPETV